MDVALELVAEERSDSFVVPRLEFDDKVDVASEAPLRVVAGRNRFGDHVGDAGCVWRSRA